MNKDLNLYATREVLQKIKERFGYVFEKLVPEANGFYYKPCLIPHEISSDFNINDLKISSFEQNHGFINSTGFRFNNFAYCTDVLEFDEIALDKLKGLDLWIVDCLRFKPHKTHAHFDKVMEWMKLLKPKQTILTHMNYEVDYDTIMSKVPKNCIAAYDGLKVKV